MDKPSNRFLLKNIACQSLGWNPPCLGTVALRGVPACRESTRPPRRARSQRGVNAPPGADPWPPEPPQTCCTLGNDTLKATLRHVVAGSKTDSPTSSLVSSQGVSSPPLPNGCGQELNGPSLYRDQKGKMSGVTYNRRKPRHEGRQGERTKRPPLPSPLGLQRGQGPLRTSGRASSRT